MTVHVPIRPAATDPVPDWRGPAGDPCAALPAAAVMAPAAPVPDPAPPLAWRIAFAGGFVAILALALVRLAPVPAAPAVRIELPPELPDPAALLPLAEDAARTSNAGVPFAAPAHAANPFRSLGWTPDALARATDCLAAAVWYEAGDDPSGQRAVAQVVLNRVRHAAFPGSVCGVVFQGSERQAGCQFTFTCDGSLDRRRPAPASWARARAVASAMLAGQVDPVVGLSTHYHADYVVPRWRDGLVKLAQVGAHLFYRWPGRWGEASAYRRSGTGAEPQETALSALSPVHGDQVQDAGHALAASLPDDETLTEEGRAAALDAQHAGGRVQAAADPASAEPLELTLAPGAFPGSYALRALELCGAAPHCVVTGRSGVGTPLGFLYVRDRSRGAEAAWWNCTATPRKDQAQCLPAGAAAEQMVRRYL